MPRGGKRRNQANYDVVADIMREQVRRALAEEKRFDTALRYASSVTIELPGQLPIFFTREEFEKNLGRVEYVLCKTNVTKPSEN